MPIEYPKLAGLRDAADLARGVCTPQAVYSAIRQGYLPCTPVGRLKKMTPAAFAFHARFGWGPGVPRHGTAEAVEYQRQRDAEEAAARAAIETEAAN